MNKQILWASILAVLLLASCRSNKDYIYLQDMRVGSSYPFDTNIEATIQRDDRLSITVSCKNPELAIPFNIHGGSFSVNADGSISAGSS